ncbi:hypothetical protein INR49_022478 [Caranx melampygus]|nr:hypothetical protein INR49_022478 [Caranx melampygus]
MRRNELVDVRGWRGEEEEEGGGGGGGWWCWVGIAFRPGAVRNAISCRPAGCSPRAGSAEEGDLTRDLRGARPGPDGVEGATMLPDDIAAAEAAARRRRGGGGGEEETPGAVTAKSREAATAQQHNNNNHPTSPEGSSPRTEAAPDPLHPGAAQRLERSFAKTHYPTSSCGRSWR